MHRRSFDDWLRVRTNEAWGGAGAGAAAGAAAGSLLGPVGALAGAGIGGAVGAYPWMKRKMARWKADPRSIWQAPHTPQDAASHVDGAQLAQFAQNLGL